MLHVHASHIHTNFTILLQENENLFFFTFVFDGQFKSNSNVEIFRRKFFLCECSANLLFKENERLVQWCFISLIVFVWVTWAVYEDPWRMCKFDEIIAFARIESLHQIPNDFKQ